MHVRSDGGVVLVHAIIVGSDGTAADVGMLAQVGVAHIAQMRHFSAVADVCLLHFHEGAGLGFFTKIVARAQVRPWADVGRAANVALLHAGTLHMGIGIDDRTDKRRVWADLRALSDYRAAFEEAAGKDHGVTFDTHVIFDPCGFGVENGHAFTHPMLADALVVGFGERRKLHAVVDAFDAQRVGGCECADGTVGFGGFESIGQVELALSIVGFEVGNRFSQQFGVEHVDGRVHFVHSQFAAVSVLLFHNAQHVAFAVADDAAIAGRIVKNGGEHGGTIAALLMEGKQLVQRVGIEQRHI